jgi:hypothetical protein
MQKIQRSWAKEMKGVKGKDESGEREKGLMLKG